MEEPLSEDIRKVVQELGEDQRAQESPPQDVKMLLRALLSGGLSYACKDAAEQLGKVVASSPRIVRALIGAYESDPHPDVRRAATGSLRALVHQEYLRQHPDVVESTKRALRQAPVGGETGRGRIDLQSGNLIRRLIWSSGAGLAVGLLIGLWQAEESLSGNGGLACGTGFLVTAAAGAVVGAMVGAFPGLAVQERQDRIVGIVLGAILAAFVAALSWFPILIFREVQLGWP